MSSTVARQFAEFAVATRDGELPAEVVAAVHRHLLDQAAVQIDGYDRPPVRLIREWARRKGSGGFSVVVGTDLLLEPAEAAMVNAASATAFENDDFHPAGLIHAYSAIVPAVLAVGDETELDLGLATRAIAVGVEVATRISIAGQPGMNHGRGVHPTSAVAPFGVALAVGLLHGLDAATLTQALGICGSFAGGVLEYSRSGGQVKRLHTGLAAEAGIRAVELAVLGLDGPGTVVEGPRGVLAAFSDTFDPEHHAAAMTADLGSRWDLLDTAIKPYFTNGLIQGPVMAVLELREKHSLAVDSIMSVDVGVDSMAASVCAPTSIPPRDLIDAQFSIPFAVALALVTGGCTRAEYLLAEDARFDLPDVTALARRITVRVDAEADRLFPGRFTSTVRIVTATETYSVDIDAPGTPQNPLSGQQLEAKWRAALDRDRPGRLDALRDVLRSASRSRDFTALVAGRPD